MEHHRIRKLALLLRPSAQDPSQPSQRLIKFVLSDVDNSRFNHKSYKITLQQKISNATPPVVEQYLQNRLLWKTRKLTDSLQAQYSVNPSPLSSRTPLTPSLHLRARSSLHCSPLASFEEVSFVIVRWRAGIVSSAWTTLLRKLWKSLLGILSSIFAASLTSWWGRNTFSVRGKLQQSSIRKLESPCSYPSAIALLALFPLSARPLGKSSFRDWRSSSIPTLFPDFQYKFQCKQLVFESISDNMNRSRHTPFSSISTRYSTETARRTDNKINPFSFL